jgi:anti-anti-sigma regulatory factor
MDLVIKNLGEKGFLVKPSSTVERNTESIIARIKMIILECVNRSIVLDLTGMNFLDCIRIGTIIGTYHFLEFSGKKIYILVNDHEVKKSLEKLSLSNIDVFCGSNKLALEGIA